MLLRANALAKGYSGARVETVELLVECLEPRLAAERAGRVAPSERAGDLAPLAHLALPLVGEGEAWVEGELLGRRRRSSESVWSRCGCEAKEGLSLDQRHAVHGRVGALGARPRARGSRRWRISPAPFRSRRCRARGGASCHRCRRCARCRGQAASASNILRLLQGSAINEAHRWCDKVQDAIRSAARRKCTARRATCSTTSGYTVWAELNAATDNPLVLVADEVLVSDGNFHGQPLAFALDTLAMAVAELASISERRIERLVNPNLPTGCPPSSTTRRRAQQRVHDPAVRGSVARSREQGALPSGVASIRSPRARGRRITCRWETPPASRRGRCSRTRSGSSRSSSSRRAGSRVPRAARAGRRVRATRAIRAPALAAVRATGRSRREIEAGLGRGPRRFARRARSRPRPESSSETAERLRWEAPDRRPSRQPYRDTRSSTRGLGMVIVGRRLDDRRGTSRKCGYRSPSPSSSSRPGEAGGAGATGTSASDEARDAGDARKSHAVTTRRRRAASSRSAATSRAIRAPRGAELNARSWPTEAPLRMLLNNLDPRGRRAARGARRLRGVGAAARSHDALRAIVRALLRLGDDETLLVQSGKPVGVFRTHAGAPRVLMANSLLVPRWATWDEFRGLEARGADDVRPDDGRVWIYIGTQGILQGTYQTFAAAAEKHFGTVDLPGGPSSRPGSAEWAGRSRSRRRWPAPRCCASRSTRRGSSDGSRQDTSTRRRIPRRRAGARACGGARPATPLGRRWSAMPPTSSRSWHGRGEHFDLVTDQTAAHDPLTGYIPRGLTVAEAAALRRSDPDAYLAGHARRSSPRRGMLAYVRQGSYVFDYGNNLRGEAREAGVERRSHTRASSRPISGRSSAAASGLFGGLRCRATRRTSRRSTMHCELSFLETRFSRGGSRGALTRRVPGAPRADLLARLRRPRAGRARDQRPRPSGKVRAPRRDRTRPSRRRLRRVSVPRDGGDAGRLRRDRGLADPQRAVNTAAGATWVSVHHGGGVGIGNAIHAGMVVVADGTDELAERLERVLTTDPGTGVIRHVDAGYREAVDAARAHGLDLPVDALE